MEQRKFSRAATAAFTGHRFVDASLREHVRKRLTRAVLDAYGNGIRNFIFVFAIGFDMMAAEEVVSLKQTYPDITLTADVPFKEQSSRFSFYDRKRYDKLLEGAWTMVAHFKSKEIKKIRNLALPKSRILPPYYNLSTFS